MATAAVTYSFAANTTIAPAVTGTVPQRGPASTTASALPMTASHMSSASIATRACGRCSP